MSLIVCEGCGRHVHEGERACPFCDATLRTEAPTASAGMARAALFTALTVAAGMSLQACYGGPPRPHAYNEVGPRDGGATMQVAAPPQKE